MSDAFEPESTESDRPGPITDRLNVLQRSAEVPDRTKWLHFASYSVVHRNDIDHYPHVLTHAFCMISDSMLDFSMVWWSIAEGIHNRTGFSPRAWDERDHTGRDGETLKARAEVVDS